MTYEKFIEVVKNYVKKSGIDKEAKFENDTEKGLYIARVCGVRITGNGISNRVTVIANGRKFMA